MELLLVLGLRPLVLAVGKELVVVLPVVVISVEKVLEVVEADHVALRLTLCIRERGDERKGKDDC